jgi:hypothetical protein
MSCQCVNNSKVFCYICGQFTLSSQKKTIRPVIKNACELYFGCKTSDQDKNWASHICCSKCAVDVRACLNGKQDAMPFAVPMVSR